MTSHTNRNHIIRAALESIAYQIRDVLDMMKQQGNINLRAINADGGATRNRFLMQFIADMTGLEVSVAQMPDCSPLGAALAGMLGVGIHPSLGAIASLPFRWMAACTAARVACSLGNVATRLPESS